VFEGVYRDVNIALANELARFSDEAFVDVREAIEVANTQPYCDIHDPGAGVGGHCIPYYPYFLIEQFATDAPLLRTARDVNDQMPAFTAGKVAQGLDRRGVPVDGATVVLLGLTYRPGVRETRKSPAKPIARRLSSFGADVYGVDPVLDDAGEFAVTPLSVEKLQDIDPDAAVMVTAHDAFEDVDWTAFDPMVVVDGRDALDLDGSYHGVYTIGRGWHAAGDVR
jgi:UDP-N-acetyl-D-mannosaminuronic acid dehydrogenase